MRYLAAVTFLLAQPAGWKPPAVRIQDEGALQGYASTLNCVGAGISCSVGASVATLSVTGGGGGGGSPGGVSGNVQINSAGAFGTYTGTTCAYAVKSLDANGAASCTAAPSIPADVSGASFWTRVAEPGLSNETALGALGTGIILNTTTTGVPTIYGGTSCAYAIASLNASGVASCQAAPTIPADISAKKYLIQTADAALPNAQAMGALGTGLVKNTTTTGVQSIAVSGTDYAPATSGVAILKGNNAGGFSSAIAGTDYQAPLTLPLSLANGGTGAALTASNGAIPYSTATAMALLAPGTAGQVLVSGGAGAPTWGNGCVTLGTATGAATTVGPVTWTGTYGTLMIEYVIAGYNGGTPVGRVLMGAASISTTALTNGNSMYEGVAGTLTNALSIPGAPLAVTLSAIGRCGTMTVRGASGALKSYEIIGGNGNLSVSAARTLFRSVGQFSDLSTNLPIQRAQLTVYDTLTATAASAQAFLTGTRITVIGCP